MIDNENFYKWLGTDSCRELLRSITRRYRNGDGTITETIEDRKTYENFILSSFKNYNLTDKSLDLMITLAALYVNYRKLMPNPLRSNPYSNGNHLTGNYTLNDATNTYNEGIFAEIRDSFAKSLKSKRVGVVRKVFNYETGCLEYELEDGNFTKINSENVIYPKIDIDYKFFPEGFIKMMDITQYRDMIIDKISDNGS